MSLVIRYTFRATLGTVHEGKKSVPVPDSGYPAWKAMALGSTHRVLGPR